MIILEPFSYRQYMG